MSVSLQSYREACSVSLHAHSSGWFTCDSLGQLHFIDESNMVTSKDMSDAAITAWCVAPGGQQCALGTDTDNSLTLHSFPDYSLNKEPLFGKRRTLPITCIR